MTTTTVSPADRAAYEALVRPDRPAGAQVLRLDTPRGVQLAAGDEDLIVGMPVVKVGVFNGVFEVTRDDLDAFVSRFNDLATVFRPPMRLDHSWSVMDVIGRFEALRVENLPDPSIGDTVVPYLVADWRLVGTKAQKAELRERMTGEHPHLLERSAEFWPYRTNAGAEYPLVFAGCAFVDIPAVEGLGAVTLRRSHGQGEDGSILASDGNDNNGGTVPEDQENPTPTPADPAGEATPPAPPAPQDPPAEDPPAEDPPAGPEESPTVEGDDDPEPTPDADPVETPAGPPSHAELSALLASAGATLSAEQRSGVDAYIAEQVRLRQETEERYTRHLSRGVIPKPAQESIRGLLSHTDPEVRDGIAAYLELVHPPVKLRQKDGHQTSTAPGSLDPKAATPESASGAGFEEFMAMYANLTTEQRNAPEWEKAYAEQVRLHNAAR